MRGNAVRIPASKFKAQCLMLMDRVAASRRAIVITKRGRPVAKLVPVEPTPPISLFGCMKGTVISRDDLLATNERWEVDA